ncbi:GtrA family protein [Phenylobacterium sp.]|uniref:GtrA family protein n=1 Tax=Phenylobacterium sp. TaxID=1871053 RepID=UPI002F94954F
MKALLSIYLTREFKNFLLAGGAAAAANFGSRFVFDLWLEYLPSVVAAYGVGLATAFLLNRLFVFPPSGKGLRRELAWFAFFNALAFPVTLGAALFLHSHLFGHFLPDAASKALAHGVGIILPVVVNFAAHKFITFRPAGEPPR